MFQFNSPVLRRGDNIGISGPEAGIIQLTTRSYQIAEKCDLSRGKCSCAIVDKFVYLACIENEQSQSETGTAVSIFKFLLPYSPFVMSDIYDNAALKDISLQLLPYENLVIKVMLPQVASRLHLLRRALSKSYFQKNGNESTDESFVVSKLQTYRRFLFAM